MLKRLIFGALALAALAGIGAPALVGQVVTTGQTYPPSQENRACNGAVAIDQFNAGAAVTPNTLVYVVDCWKTRFTNNALLTFQQDATQAPPGFLNSMKVSVGTQTSIITTTQLEIEIQISGLDIGDLGFGTANAKPVVVSFWLYADQIGNYSFSLENASRTRGYVQNCNVPVASTWTYCVFAIPGDTAATWVTSNAVAMLLRFDLGSGSNKQCAPGSWQGNDCVEASTGSPVQFVTLANTTALRIGAVRLRAGTFDVPYSIPSYQAMLADVRRYYQTSFPAGTAPAQNAGIAGATCTKNPIALGDPSAYVQFNPPMASSPTITTYNPSVANANWRDVTAAADSTVSVDPASAKNTTGVLIATSGTVATLGDALCIHWAADARL